MGHCGVVSRQRRSVSSRKRNDRAPAYIAMQRAAFDKDAAPNDFAGFADALQRTAAEGKVHGGLTLADAPA